jgi:hypothetical protein
LQYPGRQRYFFAFQPVGIAGAVTFFVMMSNDRQNVTKRLQWSANALPDYRVVFHDLSLFRGQGSLLEQNVLGNSHFADIVNDPTEMQRPAQV